MSVDQVEKEEYAEIVENINEYINGYEKIRSELLQVVSDNQDVLDEEDLNLFRDHINNYVDNIVRDLGQEASFCEMFVDESHVAEVIEEERIEDEFNSQMNLQ